MGSWCPRSEIILAELIGRTPEMATAPVCSLKSFASLLHQRQLLRLRSQRMWTELASRSSIRIKRGRQSRLRRSERRGNPSFSSPSASNITSSTPTNSLCNGSSKSARSTSCPSPSVPSKICYISPTISPPRTVPTASSTKNTFITLSPAAKPFVRLWPQALLI